MLLGDSRAAEAHAHAVISAASEYHLRPWWGVSTILRGWALAYDGRAQEGLALARQGIAYNDAISGAWHGPLNLMLLADIHRRLGDLAEALRAMRRRRSRYGALAKG